MSERVVIVGAGQAGLQAAISLRQGGFDGDVVLLGKERWLPYQRPPLSKQVLKDHWPAEKCQLRPQSFLESSNIEFRAGATALRLDAPNRQVLLEDGEAVGYDHLVLCTGSRLNRLRFDRLPSGGVHYLRTLDDAFSLREGLSGGLRLAVIGAGYIGLEVAASARALGCEVAVIEAQPAIMQRSALPPIAEFLAARHRNEGVALHLGRHVIEVRGDHRVESIILDDGTRLAIDVLVIGIGVKPDLEWLADSGLDLGRGIRVDAQCRTSIANVYAAGDCAECRHPLFPQPVVLESVQNATDQAKVAAATIMGGDQAYSEVPWFWSEQFDCRFQMAGLPQPGDRMVIRETGEDAVSVLSLGGHRLNAVQCVNNPRDYMGGRKLIARGREVDLPALADPACDLRTML